MDFNFQQCDNLWMADLHLLRYSFTFKSIIKYSLPAYLDGESSIGQYFNQLHILRNDFLQLLLTSLQLEEIIIIVKKVFIYGESSVNEG